MHHRALHPSLASSLPPLAIDRLLVERGYKARLGPWSMATAQTRLAALSKAHDQYIAGNAYMHMGPEKNPLRDPRVRQLISAARRAYARRGREAVRPVAATRHVIEALLCNCGDDLIGNRDRAMLLFRWTSGGRRRLRMCGAMERGLFTTYGDPRPIRADARIRRI